MTRSGHSPATVTSLANALSDHLDSRGVVTREELARDPITALAADHSVAVTLVDHDQLPAHCSIAAAYFPHTAPATILISNDQSTARRAFSCLHEYAHHLRHHVDAILDALFKEHDGGAALEEDICDAFAASILIPRSLTQSVLSDGVTAQRVADLKHRTNASREACAVAAAAQLPAPGYVMLLDQHGVARFTARRADALPIARETRQTQTELRAAARTRRGRGLAQVTFATGNLSPEMFFDAAPLETITVCVIVADSPVWETFTAGPRQPAERKHGYCEACGHDFDTSEPPCAECGEPRCPTCRECGCLPALRPTIGERKCDRCGYTLGPGAFPSRTSRVCRECG
jgi:Zn-dependent peptidase ImmA (M78 family)